MSRDTLTFADVNMVFSRPVLEKVTWSSMKEPCSWPPVAGRRMSTYHSVKQPNSAIHTTSSKQVYASVVRSARQSFVLARRRVLHALLSAMVDGSVLTVHLRRQQTQQRSKWVKRNQRLMPCHHLQRKEQTRNVHYPTLHLQSQWGKAEEWTNPLPLSHRPLSQKIGEKLSRQQLMLKRSQKPLLSLTLASGYPPCCWMKMTRRFWRMVDGWMTNTCMQRSIYWSLSFHTSVAFSLLFLVKHASGRLWHQKEFRSSIRRTVIGYVFPPLAVLPTWHTSMIVCSTTSHAFTRRSPRTLPHLFMLLVTVSMWLYHNHSCRRVLTTVDSSL